jgi:hypothetical protein
MRQHCAQCLIPLHANYRQAPTGELLCVGCYSALWNSRGSEKLRMRVEGHSDLSTNRRSTLINRR